MADSEDELEFGEDEFELNEDDEEEETRTRGATTLRKWNGTKEIEFNDLGLPIGTNQAPFSNYCGALTKRKISIEHITWFKVPKDDKAQVWLTIKKYWRIEDDEHKNEVLKLCNSSWKRFKTRLRNRFMDKGKEPFEKYNFLEKKVWADFVARENTEERKKIRALARERAKKKKDPPHTGPKGYRGMQSVWSEEAKSNDKSTAVHHIRDQRARDYLLSRMILGEDGVRVLPPEFDDVLKQLVDYDKRQTDGTWRAEPGMDILSTVIGPEHNGRTRAVGYTTGWKKGITDYAKRKGKRESILELREQMKAMAARQKKLEAQVTELSQRSDTVPACRLEDIPVASPELKRSSCDSRTPELELDWLDQIEVPTKCYLLLPYGIQKIGVAIGMVQPIRADQVVREHHVSVLVDTVRSEYENFHLPVPLGNIVNLVQAKSSFIEWPRKAIEVHKRSTEGATVSMSGNEGTSSKTERASVSAKNGSKSSPTANKELAIKKLCDTYYHKVQNRPPFVKQLYEHWMKRENPSRGEKFKIDNAVFGKEMNMPYFTISPGEIMRLMTNGWLDMSIITWFSMTCHKLQNRLKKPRCAFINPYLVSHNVCTESSNNVISYIKSSTQDRSKYYIIPFSQGGHWSLYIICLRDNRGYILDSNRMDKIPLEYTLTELVDEAVGCLSWELPVCQQQKQTWECGYYLMKWMHQFILFEQHQFHEKIPWNTTESFSAKELDSIVGVWITHYMAKS